MNDFEIIFFFKYNLLYYIFSTITLIVVIEFYVKNVYTSKIQNFLLPVLCIILILMFGYRDESVGTDTHNNIKYFKDRFNFFSLKDVNDIGLFLVSKFVVQFTDNVAHFLSILSLLYITPIYIGIKTLRLVNPLVFFFVFFSMFSFISMGINIQQQGIAFSLFCCGLIFFISKKVKTAFLLFFIAFLFHASILIPIVIFLIANKIKSLNISLSIYILTTILSIVNFKLDIILMQIPIINILVQSRLETLLIDRGNYLIGFRPDFWLFNTVFALIGYFTFKNYEKLKVSLSIEIYQRIYVSYLLVSSYFFLMFSAPFSDRFGILAWMFIPFLLYPYIISRKSNRFLNTVSIFFICLVLATFFKFS